MNAERGGIPARQGRQAKATVYCVLAAGSWKQGRIGQVAARPLPPVACALPALPQCSESV